MEKEAVEAFKRIEKVKTFSKNLKEGFDKKVITDANLGPYQHLLILVLNEVELFLESIELLCKHGLGDPAGLIQRTLFEVYITVKFLKKHPEFIDRYVEYGAYAKGKQLESLIKHGANLTTSEQNGDFSKDEIFEEAKQAREKHSFKGNSWYPPDFPKIRDLCEDQVDKENYELFYRYICDFSHFNVLSLGKHSYDKGEDAKTILINTKMTLGIEHLHGACSLALALYQHFNLEFKLGLEDAIDGL